MNKRKLERKYQRLLKKNEALKGALFNCAIQLQTTLDRHGADMSMGQNQWYMDFIEFVEDEVKCKLPEIQCVTLDMLTMDETVHKHFQDTFQVAGSATGRITFDLPEPQIIPRSKQFESFHYFVNSNLSDLEERVLHAQKDIDNEN